MKLLLVPLPITDDLKCKSANFSSDFFRDGRLTISLIIEFRREVLCFYAILAPFALFCYARCVADRKLLRNKFVAFYIRFAVGKSQEKLSLSIFRIWYSNHNHFDWRTFHVDLKLESTFVCYWLHPNRDWISISLSDLLRFPRENFPSFSFCHCSLHSKLNRRELPMAIA